MSRTSYCNKVPFRYLLWALCDDVQLCNRCVREFLILTHTWFALDLPSKTGCDSILDFDRNRCSFRTELSFPMFPNYRFVFISGVTIFNLVSKEKYENENGFNVYRSLSTIFTPNYTKSNLTSEYRELRKREHHMKVRDKWDKWFLSQSLAKPTSTVWCPPLDKGCTQPLSRDHLYQTWVPPFFLISSMLPFTWNLYKL
jgi:hypothetical protein